LRSNREVPPNELQGKPKQKALRLIKKAKTQFTEIDIKKILSFYGIQFVREKLASSLQEALCIANSFSYPVALKIECPDILHKTDVMGVELNIHNNNELEEAFERIYKRFQGAMYHLKIRGFLVQEMVTDHVAEVIVGITQDPQFGPTIMFGLGGFMVEAIEDVSFRICPITSTDAKEMVQEIRGYQILTGFRGKPKADIAALEEVLVKLSHLAVDLSGSIREIEINPLMVFPEGKGVKAADIILLHKQVK